MINSSNFVIFCTGECDRFVCCVWMRDCVLFSSQRLHEASLDKHFRNEDLEHLFTSVTLYHRRHYIFSFASLIATTVTATNTNTLATTVPFTLAFSAAIKTDGGRIRTIRRSRSQCHVESRLLLRVIGEGVLGRSLLRETSSCLPIEIRVDIFTGYNS